METRGRIVVHSTHDQPRLEHGQVLYVGAPCAGLRERGRWTCRCRARSPQGCKTETAPGCAPITGSTLAFELLKRDPKVARRALVVVENQYAKVKKTACQAKRDAARDRYATALLAAVRAIPEGESIAWRKLMLKARVPKGNSSKAALRVLVGRGYLFKDGSYAWTTYRPNRKNKEPYREP